MVSIQQAMELALQHHHAGRLRHAEDVYKQVLRADPMNPDALHLLGLVAYQNAQPTEAIDWIRKALAYRPQAADFHSDLGLAYQAAGSPGEAVECYRTALRLQPGYAAAQANLGNTLLALGKLEEALASYRQAVRLNPNSAEARFNLGHALHKAGNLNEAVENYELALRLKPNYAKAHLNLGALLWKQGNNKKAEERLREGVRLQPENIDGHLNLGHMLLDSQSWEEAESCYRQVIHLQGDHAGAYNGLGHALRMQGKLEEALASLRHSVELQPDLVDGHHNLGLVLSDLGSMPEAIASYDEVLRRRPDHADVHLCRALAWLLMGDYERGWQEYEWRWECWKEKVRPFAQPMWDGSRLDGRTIFLYPEQGMGDTLQFMRYAALVKQHGCKVIVDCQDPLLPLVQNCPGIDELVTPGRPIPHFDVRAPFLSLPRILKTTLVTIPAQVPYLFPNAEAVRWWSDAIDKETGRQGDKETRREGDKEITGVSLSPCLPVSLSEFRVGIAWQGNPDHKGDRYRSVPLRLFTPLGRLPGVQLFSLQKGPGAEQLSDIAKAFSVIDLGSRFEHFLDLAAAQKNLDLTITVDTAVAHSAGALGLPVWVLLPFSPDWRWLLHREESPWYPTMRLFRQKHHGNWEEVFERIAREVRSLTKQLAGRVDHANH